MRRKINWSFVFEVGLETLQIGIAQLTLSYLRIIVDIFHPQAAVEYCELGNLFYREVGSVFDVAADEFQRGRRKRKGAS